MTDAPTATCQPEHSVDIRVAVDGDLPALVAAFDQAEYLVDRLERQRRGAGDLLVAWLSRRPVGLAYLWREPAPEPEIRAKMAPNPMIEIHVVPGCRRRGVGTGLLDQVERLAFAHGHGFVWVAVSVDDPVRSLFNRRGYDDWGFGPVAIRRADPTDAGPSSCHVLLKGVDPSVPGLDAWQAWHPSEAAAVLAGVAVTWCVAAGWAIDLHLGRQTREHSDLEIAIPRGEFDRYRAGLSGFDLYDAGRGRVRRLRPGDHPDPAHHQVWVCEPAIPAWRMDTFLEPGDRETWISHRDPVVRMPMPEAVRHTAGGIPYLSPELVLFTKAKHARDKDEADLANVLPTLTGSQRRWLVEAIRLVHPGHRWLGRLEA
ncbi:MAG TPA: GNAT family N-acetyltransferase [Micromonosporaceae bacterium]